jgi:hypothetical protein
VELLYYRMLSMAPTPRNADAFLLHEGGGHGRSF